MATNGKLASTDTETVFQFKDGLGGVTVTLFDHHGGGRGAEQCVGSITFPNYEQALGIGQFFLTPRDMAEAIWNVGWALDAAKLRMCGSCFAFSREYEAPPTECPKDGFDEDLYVPIWRAYDDLMESRTVDGGIDITPFPCEWLTRPSVS